MYIVVVVVVVVFVFSGGYNRFYVHYCFHITVKQFDH